MKIGKNIKEIRESKGYNIDVVANLSKVEIERYTAIENDESDITLTELENIAKALSCSPIYILQFKESDGSIYNHFENKEGNKGTNIKIQGINPKEIAKTYKEIYRAELERIPKLEKLLRDNNIQFDI